MKGLLCALALGATLTLAAPALGAEYIMSPGDNLQIIVTGYEEFGGIDKGNSVNTNIYVIRPDGKVTFPLVGVLDTNGKTISEFTAELTRRLSEYLVNPDVNVNLARLGTTRVFMLGEVGKAGMYELTKSHRVLDAIGAAGGFTEYAAKKNIFLIRDGKAETIQKINLNAYLTKGDMSQNLVLQEGDCLYLTGNKKINITKDILPWLSGAYYIKRMNKDD